VSTTRNAGALRLRNRRHRAAALAGLALCGALGGCASVEGRLRNLLAGPSEPVPEDATAAPDTGDRLAQLEMEVEWVRADLRAAEAAMRNTERGLRGDLSPADAVSILAESRIEVARAARDVPWGHEHVTEAQEKLAEAERQLQAGQTGSAVFFASRARRIAAALNIVAERVERSPETRFISGRRVNIRSGPSPRDRIIVVLTKGTPVFPERTSGEWLLIRAASGEAGWVHESLVSERAAPTSDATTQSLPASLAR